MNRGRSLDVANAAFCLVFGLSLHPAVKTKSNLKTICEDGSDDEDSEEDSDYEDELGSVVSDLSDNYSFDTITTAFQSKAYITKKKEQKKQRKAKKAAETGAAELPAEALMFSAKAADELKQRIHGNTQAGLPFLLDMWRDSAGRPRISVQVHLLSGRGAHKKVLVRISTDGKELVLSLPMSEYMSRSDFAFRTFLIDKESMSETELYYVSYILKLHPKTAARIVSASKIKGRSITNGFYYEQRIRLPRSVKREFAKQNDGDKMFHGKKFIQYPDGSVHLHCELIGDTKDSYIPEERILDPDFIKTVQNIKKTSSNKDNDPMDVDQARVLSDESVASKPTAQPKKRSRNDDMSVASVQVEDASVNSKSNEIDDEEDAETLFQAQSDEFRQVREEAEATLKKANQSKSSLAAAAEKGAAAGESEEDDK